MKRLIVVSAVTIPVGITREDVVPKICVSIPAVALLTPELATIAQVNRAPPPKALNANQPMSARPDLVRHNRRGNRARINVLNATVRPRMTKSDAAISVSARAKIEKLDPGATNMPNSWFCQNVGKADRKWANASIIAN